MKQENKYPSCGSENSMYVRVKAVIDVRLNAKSEWEVPKSIVTEEDISLEDQAVSCFCGDCGLDSADGNPEMLKFLLVHNN